MTLDRWVGIEKEKPKIDIGKPLGVRNLVDVRPGWKPDIVALGRYRRIPILSKEVKLSVFHSQFLELIEKDEVIDCEELWNRFYDLLRMEISPKEMGRILKLLTRLGLVERIDDI